MIFGRARSFECAFFYDKDYRRHANRVLASALILPGRSPRVSLHMNVDARKLVFLASCINRDEQKIQLFGPIEFSIFNVIMGVLLR